MLQHMPSSNFVCVWLRTSGTVYKCWPNEKWKEGKGESFKKESKDYDYNN